MHGVNNNQEFASCRRLVATTGCFFPGQPAVKGPVFAFFTLQRFLSGNQVARVVPRPTDQPASVDFNDPVGELLKKGPVVSDEQYRTGKIHHALLELQPHISTTGCSVTLTPELDVLDLAIFAASVLAKGVR